MKVPIEDVFQVWSIGEHAVESEEFASIHLRLPITFPHRLDSLVAKKKLQTKPSFSKHEMLDCVE